MEASIYTKEEVMAKFAAGGQCAQCTLVPWADALGYDEDELMRMAAAFAGGMFRGDTCGAVVGALMALGLAGLDDVPMLQEIYRGMKARHNGHLECRDLLAENAALGLPKKPHCDAMVYEMVGITEELLRKYGKMEF